MPEQQSSKVEKSMCSWSKKEDMLLLQWAAKYGPSGWSYLLPKLNLKSVQECSSRYDIRLVF